jgi:hypothetical protein
MVMQRITPPTYCVRKLQDRRAKELDEPYSGDSHSESWREEFESGPSCSPRLKPTLPKVTFLERPDLSKL